MPGKNTAKQHKRYKEEVTTATSKQRARALQEQRLVSIQKQNRSRTKSKGTSHGNAMSSYIKTNWRDYFSNILEENTDTPTAVGAIITLSHVLSSSSETTLQGLLLEVRAVADELKTFATERSDLAIISMDASMDVFLLYVTRVATRMASDFDTLRSAIVERAEKFVQLYINSRDKIASVGSQFIRDGSTVLVHGYSRVVLGLLVNAAMTCNFTVLVTEGRPVGAGCQTKKKLAEADISCEVILGALLFFCLFKGPKKK
jgi:translation initiation factor eIF-2B subunit alpha